MAAHDDKRRYRKLKRDIKQAGNRKRRRRLQRDLMENPEEAAHSEPGVGPYSSAGLNGNDRDATRRKKEEGDHGIHGIHGKKTEEQTEEQAEDRTDE